MMSAEPSVRMVHLLYAALVTQMVAVCAELGVADLLSARPRPVSELAELTGADPEALYRVLRALASQGVFTEVTPRTFGLTPMAATLRTDAPGSMRDFARYWSLPQRHAAIGELRHSVRTGDPGFDHAFGMDWWSHLSANPEAAAVFNNAMGNLASHIHAAALRTHDLSDVRRLVDVGGGTGQLAAAILARYPDMTAVVFDRPEVAAGAGAALAEAGVRERAQPVGGDFFESVPAGGDAYVLSMILHDWNDADAVKILANVRRAMDPSGRVIVLDAVIPEGDAPHLGKLLDISMLTLVGGRERTEVEFRHLFAAAGLRHTQTTATASPTSVIVAVPAGREPPREQ